MRVVVADDDRNVRSALRLFLTLESDLEVVAEAGGVSELPVLLRRVQPDVLLLDWDLSPAPRQLIAELTERFPNLVVVAMSSRPEDYRSALEAGAVAFACKADPPESVLAALAFAERSLAPSSSLDEREMCLRPASLDRSPAAPAPLRSP